MVKSSSLENRGQVSWISRVRPKLEKIRKRRSVVPFSLLSFVFLSLILTTNPKMQSQNTPSPRNKKEMKSTNLIFTPSYVFSNFSFFFVLLRSFFFCFFGISFLLMVHKTKRNYKSKIFSFPIKLSTNMADNPFPKKKLEMWPCFTHSFAFKIF